MKLKQDDSPIFTNTDKDNSVDFSVEASSLFFQIMSSQIYEHKERATVRELVCNARDSQTEVVRDGHTLTPFIVKFPNKLEPWFSVEDFGTGMSEEVINQVYSVALKSTKRDSDEDIGGFGVGKFAPLSYVDQFQLISRSEGVECTYSVFRQNGKPSINLVRKVNTNEVNGVKVVVPVSTEDFSLFEEEIKGILKWFPSESFTAVGTDQEIVSVIPKDGFKTCGEYGYTFDYSPNHDYSEIVAIVGNVAYPCNTSVKLSNLVGNYKTLIVELPINSVEVAISRENLSMTKETKNFIDRVVEEIKRSLLQDLQNVLDGSDTLYSDEVLGVAEIINRNSSKLTFKGLPLHNWVIDKRADQLPDSLRTMYMPGWKNVKARKEKIIKTPWLHGGVNILVLDSKYHIQHNRNEMYKSSELCVQVDKEDLDDTLTLFKDCKVNVEYLSERVAAGCKPEKKVSTSSVRVNQQGYPTYYLKGGEYAVHTRRNRKQVLDLYDEATSEGRDLYIKVMAFTRNTEVQKVCQLSRYLPDDVEVLLVNCPVGQWLYKQRTYKRLEELTFSDEWLDNYRTMHIAERTKTTLSWRSKRGLRLLNSLREVEAGLLSSSLTHEQEDVIKIINCDTTTYSEVMVDLFPQVREYISNTGYAETAWLEGWADKISEFYPLLFIDRLSGKEREEAIWYIKAKEEYLKKEYLKKEEESNSVKDVKIIDTNINIEEESRYAA